MDTCDFPPWYGEARRDGSPDPRRSAHDERAPGANFSPWDQRCDEGRPAGPRPWSPDGPVRSTASPSLTLDLLRRYAVTKDVDARAAPHHFWSEAALPRAAPVDRHRSARCPRPVALVSRRPGRQPLRTTG